MRTAKRKIAVLIQERRNDLNQARQKYESELSEAIGKVTITPLQAAPNCVTAFAIGNSYHECPFKRDTFLARNTPASHGH